MKLFKKTIIYILCTVLLVFEISVAAYKPIEARAEVGTLAVSAVALEEILKATVALLGVALVAQGAYELYENNDAFSDLVDLYFSGQVGTLEKPQDTTLPWDYQPNDGIGQDLQDAPALPDWNDLPTWGDQTKEEFYGKYVRNPNNGKWERLPDEYEWREIPAGKARELGIPVPDGIPDDETTLVRKDEFDSAFEAWVRLNHPEYFTDDNNGGGGGGDNNNNGHRKIDWKSLIDDTANNGDGLVKVGAATALSINNFLQNLFDGNVDTSQSSAIETALQNLEEVGMPHYNGEVITGNSGDRVPLSYRCIGAVSRYNNKQAYKVFNGDKMVNISHDGAKLYITKGTTPNSYGEYFYQYVYAYPYNDGYYKAKPEIRGYFEAHYTDGTITSNATIVLSTTWLYLFTNLPIFNEDDIDAINAYLNNGNGDGCENKKSDQPFDKDTVKGLGAVGVGLGALLLMGLSGDSAVPTSEVKKVADKIAGRKKLNNNTGEDTGNNPDSNPNNTPETPEQHIERVHETIKETIRDKSVPIETPKEPYEPAPKPTYAPVVVPELPPTPPSGTEPTSDDVTRDWHLIFPFCIPFDLIDLVRALEAEPEAPRFVLPLKSEEWGIDYEFVIDFEDFETLAEIFRVCEVVLFLSGLMVLTGKVIKW